MNVVLAYLAHNQERLRLGQFGGINGLSCLFITPRFRASAHVVCIVLSVADQRPLFVAKMPRLPERVEGLAHEANMLSLVQRSRPGGFDTVPRALMFESFRGWPILLETALVGEPMSPNVVRRNPEWCVNLVTDWLIDLHNATAAPTSQNEWFRRAVEQPLAALTNGLPATATQERDLCARTLAEAEKLRDYLVPFVFEHGDLSHPNILIMPTGRAGVVDWELATPWGVPVADLIFFLTFVAFARHRAHERERHVEAFQTAFFGEETWARNAVRRYMKAMCLPTRALPALIVLGWARYVAGLVQRLAAGTPNGRLDEKTVAWLRTNRYYRLWRWTLEHAEAFTL